MITSKLIVVLISGKAGVGKTTLANLLKTDLKTRGKDSVIIPFASSLKQVAKSMGWDGEKDERGRTLLQGLGTIGRKYDPNIWIDLSYQNAFDYAVRSGTHFFLTDDWRFPNEYDRLSENPSFQVFRFRICAPNREILRGTPQYNDISETALPECFTPESEAYYDLEVGNYGTMDELYMTAGSVVQYLLDNCQKWQVEDTIYKENYGR